MRHYSASQLRQFLRCPQQWAYRYIEKRVSPPGVALVVGSAVHFPAGKYHERGKKLGDGWTPDAAAAQMSLEEAEDLTTDAFRKLADGKDPGGEYPDGPPVDWKREDETAGQASDRAIAMAREYIQTVAPTCGRPVMVEEKLTHSPPDEPFALVIKPDLVAVDSAGRVSLRDIKTSGKAPNGIKSGTIEVDDDNRRQLVIYSYGHRVATGTEPDIAGIDFVWSNKSGAHSAHAPVTILDGDEQEVFAQLRSMHSAIGRGDFMRNTAHFMCSPRWCGYFGICRPHRVSVQAA